MLWAHSWNKSQKIKYFNVRIWKQLVYVTSSQWNGLKHGIKPHVCARRRLTRPHLRRQFALKTSAEVSSSPSLMETSSMIYSNDNPPSPLSWGISHWVLMSDYSTSHSALDKWLRQAVKNRSKPLGWEKGGGGGGRSGEAVKSSPSARPTSLGKCHPLFPFSG